MLTPLQQTSGTMASNLMRSMIEQAEERRIEQERQARGKREEDDILAAKKQQQEPGVSFSSTNARIHEFFFGAAKQEADPRARLVQRFAAALGISQGADESNFSLAFRLKDALSLVASVDTSNPIADDGKVTLDRLGINAGQVTDILKGTVAEGQRPGETEKMAARYASAAGLDADSETFADDIAGVMTAARARLPVNVAALEESTGLKELGISAREMIDAIASPWSEAGLKLQAALDAKHGDAKSSHFDAIKVLQRLEDIANPRTVEELKADRSGRGSGYIEDDEIRAEREETISQLEAAEKLDDVIELQDTLGERHEAVNSAETGGDTAIDIDTVLIQALAARKSADDAGTPVTGDVGQAQSEGSEKTIGQSEDVTEVLEVSDRREESKLAIFPVRVDENGLYELLLAKAA